MGKRQRLDPESDSDADYIQVRDPPLERTVDFYKSVQVREESVACEQQALDRLRQPLNLWTDAQRLALLILRDYLDLNWRDVTRIFNLVRSLFRRTCNHTNYDRLSARSLRRGASFSQACARTE